MNFVAFNMPPVFFLWIFGAFLAGLFFAKRSWWFLSKLTFAVLCGILAHFILTIMMAFALRN
jgi:hypothetical protein